MLLLFTILPLAVIGLQLAFGLEGVVGYSLYKLAFLIPPILYCRKHGVELRRDILRFSNWRNGWWQSLGLGLSAIAVFWGAYALLGPYLVDEGKIVQKIDQQFGVTSTTVLLVAPFTVLINSLLEEFFYRGFAYGQLRNTHPRWAAIVPAAVFATQHMLFIYHWVGFAANVLAAIALLVFALVLQELYRRTETIVSVWIMHMLGDVAMMGLAIWMLYA